MNQRLKQLKILQMSGKNNNAMGMAYARGSNKPIKRLDCIWTRKVQQLNVREVNRMDKHYFTFGIGYPETVQVIHATGPEEARKRMFASYGNKFAFQYSEVEWQQALSEGFFKNASYLDPIILGGVAVDSHKQR